MPVYQLSHITCQSVRIQWSLYCTRIFARYMAWEVSIFLTFFPFIFIQRFLWPLLMQLQPGKCSAQFQAFGDGCLWGDGRNSAVGNSAAMGSSQNRNKLEVLPIHWARLFTFLHLHRTMVRILWLLFTGPRNNTCTWLQECCRNARSKIHQNHVQALFPGPVQSHHKPPQHFARNTWRTARPLHVL